MPRLLWNVTDDTIRQRAATLPPRIEGPLQWDTPPRLFIIAPDERIEVEDAVADVLMRHHERRGLVELKYGVDEEAARRQGRRAWFEYLKEIVGAHRRLNDAQRAKELPIIDANPQIRAAYWKYKQLAESEFLGEGAIADDAEAVRREVELRRDLLGQDPEVDDLVERRITDTAAFDRRIGLG